MANHDMALLLSGSNEAALLRALARRITVRNEAQRTFFAAHEAAELLASDGFEALLEQATPLEEYRAAFARIGMSGVASLFDRVEALIPAELRLPENENAKFEHIQTLFDGLKGLLYEYYEQSSEVCAALAQYVRDHRAEFSEYFSG